MFWRPLENFLFYVPKEITKRFEILKKFKKLSINIRKFYKIANDYQLSIS